MRNKCDEKILKDRDVAFIPEYMYAELANWKTIFDFACPTS